MVGPAAGHPQGAALSAEPIFRRDGDLLVPSAHTRGPWEPGAQHAGAPAALIADALRADGMLVTRITYDLLGPVPLEPLALDVRLLRPGRRLQVVEADLAAGGRTVVRARASRLAVGSATLPARADAIAPPGGGPEDAVASGFPFETEEAEGFHRTAMEIRFAAGTSYGPGPALAWFRLARPLVDDEPPSPLALVAAAADFGNGVSHVLDFETHLFVNVDLTIHLHREPRGEWVLLDARSRVEPHGAGLAASALYDEHGPIGLAAQSLYVADRPASDG